MTNWKHIATIVDGDRFEIEGLNIWNNKWTDTGERVHVKEPLYAQEYIFPVYVIISGDKQAKFAAGEFSNCVWGILSGQFSWINESVQDTSIFIKRRT